MERFLLSHGVHAAPLESTAWPAGAILESMPSMSRPSVRFCTSAPYLAVARRFVLDWTLQGLLVRGDVLEIGAGSGVRASSLLERPAVRHITVTDIDEHMVAMATQRLQNHGERATTMEVDATRLPFESERFDAVLSFAMLHHVGDWQAALREAVRVLRSGGLLIGYDLNNTRLARLLHVVEPADITLMTPHNLHAALGALPLAHIRTRPSAARQLTRFAAVKR